MPKIHSADRYIRKHLFSLITSAKGKEGARGRTRVPDFRLAISSTHLLNLHLSPHLFILLDISQLANSYTSYCYFLSKHQSWAADISSHTYAPLPGFSLQLKQLCPHQAAASTQVALWLCPPARVTPACPSFNSSADAHGKSGFSWGKGKLLIQLNAGAWGRCL